MRKNDIVIERWGALWRSNNKLDGVNQHIIFENYLPALFLTKKEAIKFIKQKYGYIATRKDLRDEPHGWRMPKPIKLKISISKLPRDRN